MRKLILSLLAVLLSLAMPAYSAVQYNLAPESFEGGAIPSGWTQEHVTGTQLWTVEGGASLANPTGAKTGSYRAVIRGTSGQVEGFVTKLITPAMNLSQSYNPQLVFSHAQVARSGYFDTLRVYYRVSATAAWQLLAEYTSDIVAWTTETILLPGYQQGSAYQLAFEASDHAGLGVVLDDVRVFPSTRCQDAYIQDITVSSHSAKISLGSNGSYDQFEIAVTTSPVADLDAFNPATDAPIYQTTDNYEITLTGLTAYQDYYLYIRTDCDDNESGYTNWVSGTFKTTMQVDLPFTETFENAETIPTGANYGHPAGWTMGGMKSKPEVPFVYKGTTGSYKNNYSVDSTCYLAMTSTVATSVFAVPADSVIYAATPEINGNLQGCEVDFWGTAYSYFSDGGSKDYASELVVGVMTDPNNLTTLTEIATVRLDNAYQFKHFTVSLSGYTGTGKYVCLASKSNKQNVFFIDNFRVREVNSPTPTGINVTNLLPTGFNVSAQLYGADSWNLKVAQVYNRDGSAIHDTLCYVNQTGLTAAQYQVQLSEQMIAGKNVYIYVQGVKNGVASDWSFPLPLHVPAMGVVPMTFTFAANANETFLVRNLVCEYHGSNSTTGYEELISPVRQLSYYPATGSSAPVFDGSYLTLNGVDNYVVFPYVADLNGLELVFRLSAGSTTFANAGRVAVGVMTDPYDLQSFTEIARFDAPAGVFNKVRAILSNYTGSGHYVAIRAISPATPHATYGSHNCLDNIRIQPISSCFDATDVSAVGAVESALIRWNPNGVTNFKLTLYTDAAHTEVDTVVYRTTPANAAMDSVTITGLAPLTDYYYSLQAICGTDTLFAEDFYTFSTHMGLPYKVDIPTATSTLPAGWEKKGGLLSDVFTNGSSKFSGSGSWTINNSAIIVDMDNPHFVLNIYSTSCKSWLISPELFIESSDAGVPTLSFKAAWTKYSRSSGAVVAPVQTSTDDKFAVLISTDGGATWSPQDAYIWANDSTGNQGLLDDIPHTGTKINIPLGAYAGKAIRVAFYGESTKAGGDNDFRLSDIRFSVVDPNCLGILSLSAHEDGMTEADINWAVSGTEELYLKVSPANGGAAVFEGTITESPYHLTGLEPNTRYDVLAYQACNSLDTLTAMFKTSCGMFELDSVETETFSPASTMFDCWKVGVGDTAGVGRTLLTLPDVVNKAGFGYVLNLEKKANTAAAGYGNDYYAIMPTFDIDSITKYQVVFDAASLAAPSDTTAVNRLYVGVITDVNDMSTFEVADTINLSYATDSTQLKTYAISFADYLGDWEGNYGKKVMFRVSAPEDKRVAAILDNVFIEPAAGCAQIIDMEASAYSSTSVTYNWTGRAAQYEVMLTTEIVDPDTIVNPYRLATGLNSPTVTFTDLPSATTFYGYVRAICASGDTSIWSSFATAKTAYTIPFLETFDSLLVTYPNDEWKVFATTIIDSTAFSTKGFTVSNTTSKMCILAVDSRISNMQGRAARTQVSSATYNGFLQTPAIDLSGVEAGRGVQLSFRAAMVPSSTSAALANMTNRTFRVYISEDGGETFEPDSAIIWATDGTGHFDYALLANANALRFNVDLSQYAGKNIALGFYSESSVSTPGGYLYIDSIAIDEYDSNCRSVDMLCATPQGKAAAITWRNHVDTAVLVDVATDDAFEHIVYHDSLKGDSVHVANLVYDQAYAVRVKPVCAEDWTMTYFKTSYGIPYDEDFAISPFNAGTWLRYKGSLLAGDNLAVITSGWTHSTTAGAGMAAGHLYCGAYRSTSAEYSYLTSSQDIMMDVRPGFIPILSMDVALTSSYSGTTKPSATYLTGRQIALLISTDGGLTWQVDSNYLWQGAELAGIPATATKIQMDLSAYAGQSIRLGLYHGIDSTATTSSSSLCYLSVDNIEIDAVNYSCVAPVLTALDSTTTSITVKMDSLAAAGYVAQISRNSSFATVLQTDTVAATDSVAQFTNLDHSSLYYVRAYKLCSATNESGWSNPITIHTECAPINQLPWTEDFESYNTQIIPYCWTRIAYTSGSTLYPYVHQTTGNNSTHSMYFYGGTSTTTQVLALPQFAAPINTLQLSFAYKETINASYGKPIVGVMSDPDDVATFIALDTLDHPGTVFTNYSVLLDEAPLDHNYIAIRYAGGTSNAALYIDDIRVEAIPQLETIKTFEVTNLTRRSITFGWEKMATCPCSNYHFIFSPTALTDEELATAEYETLNTNSYLAAKLERGTTYYAYVRTACQVDGQYAHWKAIEVTTRTLTEDIQIGDGTATAYVIFNSYGNSYTQSIFTAEELHEQGVQAGPIIGISVNFTGATATSYSKKQSIWIGESPKTSFASVDTTEFIAFSSLTQVFGPQVVSPEVGWKHYTFTTPYIWDGESDIVLAFLSNQLDGESHSTSSGWATTGTSTSPDYRSIYRYKDNQAIDPSNLKPITSGSRNANRPNIRFTVNAAACATVGAISTEPALFGVNDQRISWKASDADYLSDYSVYYTSADSVDLDTIQPQFASVDSLSVALYGLEAETTYHVYVRANCHAEGRDEGISEWAYTTFTTNPNCMPVKDLMATILDKETVEITWSRFMDDLEKNFRYVLSTTELTTEALATAAALEDTTMRLLFDTLEYSQTYHFYVRTYCGQNSQSIWQHTSFTMPESCPAVADLQVTRTSPFAAAISWKRGPYADENMWEVGIVGQPNTVRQLADTFALFLGLTSNTAYTAYVRALCAEGDTSAISTVSFTTKAEAVRECITSGEETANSYNAPFNNFYKNSWTQMIYPASVIGQEGSIHTISFLCYAGGSHIQESVTIYMANTEMEEAATTTSWVPMDDLVQVAHIENFTHPTDAGWVTIPLDTEFDYEGGNLAVVVAVNATAYSSTIKYSHTNAAAGATLRRQNDSDPSYGLHPNTATGTKYGYLPVAQFCFTTGGCASVRDLTAASITTNSAIVNWFPGSAETAWTSVLSTTPLTAEQLATATRDTVSEVLVRLTNLDAPTEYFCYVSPVCAGDQAKWKEVRFLTEATCTLVPENIVVESITDSTAVVRFNHSEAGAAAAYELMYGFEATFDIFDTATYQVVTLTDSVAQLRNLQNNSTYRVQVRALCSATDHSYWSDTVTFTTDCGVQTIFPWSEDFNSYTAGNFAVRCWTNEHTALDAPSSTYGSYVFKIASYAGIGRPSSMTMQLPNSKDGNKILLSLPAMDFNAEEHLEFAIDVYRSYLSTLKSNEGLKIYISNTDTIDASAQLIAFIPREYRVDGTNVPAADTVSWQTYTFPLPAIGTGHILIEGISEYGAATYFDNLAVRTYDPNCAGVGNLEITNIAENAADISWTTMGDDSVSVVVADQAGNVVFSRQTTASTVNVTGLNPGKKYKVTVTQICSNRSQTTSLFTLLTVPLLENASHPTNWMSTYTSGTSYYWKNTTSSSYILGEMQDTVFYLYLYATSSYAYDIRSRLMSPVVRVPALEANELLMLDYLLGATSTSAQSIRPSTVFRVDVCTFDEEGTATWDSISAWSGDRLSEIPWKNSAKFTLDLSNYAGQDIRLGFYGGITDEDTTTVLSLDNIFLRKVYNLTYDASACSTISYADDYFIIPDSEFVVGTTTYQKMLYGENGATDTLVTMHLTVGEATETIVYDTICEGQTYDRNGVNPFEATTSVVKPLFLTSINGCDSLVNVHIEVLPAQRRDTTIYACKGSMVEVNGKQFYNATVVTDTLQGINTCDSIVRTFIEFSETSGYEVDQHRIICAGDTYVDDAFPNGINAAGTYTATVKTAYGCDSTVTIHMHVANNGVAYDTVHIDNLPYVYAEDTLVGTNVGVCDLTLPVQASCGQVTLYLHVTDGNEPGDGDALENIEVLQLAIAPNPAAVGEPIDIRTTVPFTPDFRIMVFDAVGKLVYSSTEQTLTIPGMPAAGYYTIRLSADGRQYQAKLLVK